MKNNKFFAEAFHKATHFIQRVKGDDATLQIVYQNLAQAESPQLRLNQSIGSIMSIGHHIPDKVCRNVLPAMSHSQKLRFICSTLNHMNSSELDKANNIVHTRRRALLNQRIANLPKYLSYSSMAFISHCLNKITNK